MFYLIIFILFSYLLGSISTAIITCRIMKLPDPRNLGSGNPGTTNVLRIGGIKAAITTFIGDFLKGFIPVFIANKMNMGNIEIVLIALATFIGHLYPIFFKFHGGKGVATAFGIIMALYWPLGLLAITIWIVVYLFLRISALSALITAITIPIFSLYFHLPWTYLLLVIIMSLFLIWRHQSNIANLLLDKKK